MFTCMKTIKEGAVGDNGETLRKTIGSRLKELRENASEPISQDRLAEELRARGTKVEQAQIGHIEAGRRLPSVQLIIALADYYATSLDFLAGRTDNASSIEDIEEDLQTGGVSGQLGDIYRSLSAARRDEVYRFVLAQEILERTNSQFSTSLNNSGSLRDSELSSGRKAINAIFSVMQRRMAQDEINEIIDEVLEEVPEWRNLIIRHQKLSARGTSSKDAGLQG